MTRPGNDPFKTPQTPSGRTATAPAVPVAGSPEDLLFAEETASVDPTDRQSPEHWGGLSACMAAPPPTHADSEAPGELDLIAGILDGTTAAHGGSATSGTQPTAPSTQQTARPAPPQAADRIPAAAPAAPPGSVVLPALPTSAKAGTAAPALILLSLAAGAAAGVGFAVAGKLALAAGAVVLGCGAAVAIGNWSRRARR